MEEIAEQFGTPTYVYDAAKIVAQIDAFKQAFAPVDMRMKYAVKALTNLSVLQLMRQNGVQADAVSIQEVQLSIKAGYRPDEILFTPNFAPFEEVEAAVELGAMVNLDNLFMLEQFGKRFGGEAPLFLRMNPSILAGGNRNIQVGHDRSKFGIPMAQMDELLAIVKRYGLQVVGLHKHTGSDIKEAEAFTEGAMKLFNLVRHFPGLRYIDLGGGFKVPYRQGDMVLDMAQLGESLSQAFKEFCRSEGRELQLWFEPGKFLVSQAGFLLTKVTAIKNNPTQCFAGVDSGLNHLIRPMMYGGYHEVTNVSNPTGKEMLYDVVGYICETDTLAAERMLPQVREGDLLVFKNAGAYGFTMASNYNSRLRPAEVLVYQGKPHLVRQRETFEDITRHQISIF